MPTRSVDPTRSEWLNGAQACSILRCAPSGLLRAVMLGYIRARLDPGLPPRYSKEDVERHALARPRRVRRKDSASSQSQRIKNPHRASEAGGVISDPPVPARGSKAMKP